MGLSELAREGKINQHASLRDSQSIIINKPVREVWDKLADLSKWPEWHPDIVVKQAADPIEQGQSFKWKMDGTSITSKLEKVDAPSLISWTGSVLWIRAIHVWRLEPTEEDQTIVTVDESMQGFLLPLFVTHYKLHNVLVTWLDMLKSACENPD